MADDKAPEDMTDAELAEKVNPQAEAPVEEAPTEPASPKEESKEEPKEETPVEEAVAPAEEEQEEAPAPSRREQLRVQDLLNKYGPPPASRPAPQAKAPDYQELIDAEPEVYKQLEQATSQFGREQFVQGQQDTLKQVNSVKWETLLNMDAPQMESKYPVLDKNSPEFHPALADALSRRYFQMVGLNPGDPQSGIPLTVEQPGIRWRDFVEGEFELADEIASTKNQETVKNVAKQAATTGLRPDGSSAKRLNLNKDPQDMTMEELYASIGQTPPKK